MAAPNVTWPSTGTDPKSGDVDDLIASINAAFTQTYGDLATSSHTHAISDVTGLQGALDGKSASSHTHTISDVTGLQGALDGKSASSHTHTISDVTGLQAELAGKLAITSKASIGIARRGLSDTTWLTPAGGMAQVDDAIKTIEGRALFHAQPLLMYGPNRPGLAYPRFAREYEGPVSTATGFAPEDLIATEEGVGLRIYGAGMIAARDVMALKGGRKYRVYWRGRVAIDGSDPSGDALEFGVAWLNRDMLVDGVTNFETVIDLHDPLTAADGWTEGSAIIAGADLSAVDHFNDEAVYARVFVRQAGSGRTPALDVTQIGFVDVTDAQVASDITADALARITALEGADPLVAAVKPAGTDLDTLTTAGESYVANPVNAPLAAASIVGVSVRQIDPTTVRQTIWDATGSNGHTFWRVMIGGGWSEWHHAADRAYLDQQIQALLNSVTVPAPVAHTPNFIDTGGATDFLSVASYQGWEGKIEGNDAAGYWLKFNLGLTATITYTTPGTGNLRISMPYAPDVTNLVGYHIGVRPTGPFPRHADDMGLVGGISGTDGIAIGFERNVAPPSGATRFYALSEIPSGTELQITAWGEYKVIGV